VNVPSLPFLGFVAVVALALASSPRALWRRCVLFIANVAFLLTFAHDVRRLAPFLALLLLGYASVKAMETRAKAPTFAVAIGALLLVFFWLKQYAFVPHAAFLPFAYTTIGMSYVFFRIVGLVVDTYQGSFHERIGVVSYVNYTLDFVCLVSGPIATYDHYVENEREPAPFDASVAWAATERIVLGFFKVVVLSPLLAHAQDIAGAAVAPGLDLAQRCGLALVLLVAFPVFLYLNFSGYCDVVIGAARFLRQRLPENFDRPYRAKGFIELWNRWHITLSAWLRTYVYSPLLIALLRRFPARSAEPWFGVLAYFITFFIIGLWHGQTTAFAFFGILLGVGVSANKAYQIVLSRILGRQRFRALTANGAYGSLTRGVTFFWFTFSLLWFWSSWGGLAAMAGVLGWEALALAGLASIVLSAPILSAIVFVTDRFAAGEAPEARGWASPYVRTAVATSLVIVVASVEVLLRAPAPHIVYRGF
jgi:D-alanyl-lipoteichoic acid acyltransferase DltB (MBOAT superfamily)